MWAGWWVGRRLTVVWVGCESGVGERWEEWALGEGRAQFCHMNGSSCRSLLTLSTIVHRLADGAHRQHLPYRDSKLTRLLQPCLGGSSRAVIISTISPAANAVEETLNTLRFASRARRVHNVPPSAESDAGTDGTSKEQLQEQLLAQLSAEVAFLRAQLRAQPSHANAHPSPSTQQLLPHSPSATSKGVTARNASPLCSPRAAASRHSCGATSPPAGLPWDGEPAVRAPQRSRSGPDGSATCRSQEGPYPPSSKEWRQRLDALGVQASVGAPGALVAGLRALEHTALMRAEVDAHAVRPLELDPLFLAPPHRCHAQQAQWQRAWTH